MPSDTFVPSTDMNSGTRFGESALNFTQRISNILVITILIYASFVMPTGFDDGWVMSRVDALASRGFLGNLYVSADASLPLGSIHESLFAVLALLTPHLIWYRLVVALVLFVCWINLQYVVRRHFTRDALALLCGGFLFSMYAASWLISLRAEPWVLLGVSFALKGLSRLFDQYNDFDAAIVCAGACFALTAHQSGVVALALLIAFMHVVKSSLTKGAIVAALLKQVPTIVAVVTFNCFLFVDFKIWRSSVGAFSASYGDGRSLVVFGEFDRLEMLLNESPVRLNAVIFLIIVSVYGSKSLNLFDNKARKIFWVAVSSMALLALTSSKWPWHLGVLAVLSPFAGVLALQRFRSGSGLTRFLFCLGVCIAMFSAARDWSVLGQAGTERPAFQEWYAGNEGLVFLIAVLVLGFFTFSRFSDRLRNFGTWGPLALAACLAHSGVFLFGVAGVLGDSSSLLRENLSSAVLGNDCRKEVFTSLKADQWIPANLVQGGAHTFSGERSRLGGIPSLAMFGSDPSGWSGSWFLAEGNETSPDSHVGWFHSDFYLLKSADVGSVEVLTGDPRSQTYVVVFFDTDLREVGWEFVSPSLTARTSETRYFQVPHNVEYMQFWHLDESATFGGWSAFRNINLFQYEPQSAESVPQLFGTVVFIGPQEAPRYPCTPVVYPSDGVYPKYVFSSKNGSLLDSVIGESFVDKENNVSTLEVSRDSVYSSNLNNPHGFALIDYPYAETTVFQYTE